MGAARQGRGARLQAGVRRVRWSVCDARGLCFAAARTSPAPPWPFRLCRTDIRTPTAPTAGLPGGQSPFAAGTLHAMHNGSGHPVVLAAPPPTVNGTRRGGTDAASASTWRLTPAPWGPRYGEGADKVVEAVGGAEVVYLESFDQPGQVLSATMNGAGAATAGAVALRAAGLPGEAQRWRLAPSAGSGAGSRSLVLLQSVDAPGHVLSVAPVAAAASSSSRGGSGGGGRAVDGPPPPLLHRGAFASRTSRLVLARTASTAAEAQGFTIAPAAAEYPPLALWAASSAQQLEKSYLMLPLNEVVDEHYTVYFCRMEARARPPGFCRD